jgi:hypothetical protein
LQCSTSLSFPAAQWNYTGLRNRTQILDRFAALPLLVPDRRDHVDAAELRNKCLRGAIQIGTIDALLAQLCLRHDLTMLTTDRDFRDIAGHCALKLWTAPTQGGPLTRLDRGRLSRSRLFRGLRGDLH